MAIVRKSALVPFAAQQMFTLVNDMEAYPDFLPWCRSARILSHTEEEMCGEMEVARAGIRQRFSTCNRLVKNERIEIHLREGPFHKLHGTWVFNALAEDACKVELTMEFEFAGRLIDRAFGAFFSHIAATLVDAFCKRAGEVYGE